MPFQAIPIALRTDTGTPLSKLVYVVLVGACDLGHSNEGQGPYAYMEPEKLARICQATVSEVKEALLHLQRLGLVDMPVREPDGSIDWLFIDISLPMTSLQSEERRRIKCTPDQIEAIFESEPICERVCALCGEPAADDENSGWQVDHIIPQSRGGADVERNCQVVCQRCNARKRDRVHFLDFLGGRK